jgi:hypothetical protein
LEEFASDRKKCGKGGKKKKKKAKSKKTVIVALGRFFDF